MSPNLDMIIAFEEGELSEEDTIELFQGLVDTGLAWKLQGFYGRTAASLIEAGLVTPPYDATIPHDGGDDAAYQEWRAGKEQR
jgi:hypothetical protein